MKTYKILVRFDATDEQDALDFIQSMYPKDWAEHMEEAEQHHGCAAHDFDPDVDVGFVLKDGQALVDGLGFGCAHDQ